MKVAIESLEKLSDIDLEATYNRYMYVAVWINDITCMILALHSKLVAAFLDDGSFGHLHSLMGLASIKSQAGAKHFQVGAFAPRAPPPERNPAKNRSR